MEENTLKTKQEILTALAHSGDDKLLLAGLLDKEQTCEQRGYLTHTKFLDLKQRALCTDAVRLAGGTGHALFWGGYEDAERGIYLFYPDYMDAESAKLSAPLALLRARKRREDTLTHRDYLGSLMGLQIDRSVVGDILVHEEGADIIMIKPAMSYLDMVSEVYKATNVPIAAYSVSGEYAMVKAAAKMGWIDEDKIVCEMSASAYSASVSIYLNYYSKELPRIIYKSIK